MVSYSDSFVRFMPVLFAVIIFIGFGMLAIWAAKRERRTERTVNIESEAEQIFGSQSKAKNWMSRNNEALGCAPISMLDSAEGADEVRKVLASISHGGSL